MADLRARERRSKFRKIYCEFREFTMIPETNYVNTLEAASLATKIKGCVVECGVWRGGMVAGLSAVLGRDRAYYLLDSFEGLPPAQKIDGAAALNWQRRVDGPTFYDNCAASPCYAIAAMRRAGATNFKLVKGWFEDTLPHIEFGEPIAVLHFDGDWYQSAMTCLVHLYDKMAPGGIIVFDDYYVWDGCSRALHDFLSSRSAAERIRTVGDICCLRKADPHESCTAETKLIR